MISSSYTRASNVSPASEKAKPALKGNPNALPVPKPNTAKDNFGWKAGPKDISTKKIGETFTGREVSRESFVDGKGWERQLIGQTEDLTTRLKRVSMTGTYGLPLRSGSQQAKTPGFPRVFDGGAKRDRTADLYTASVALSQLSYGPLCDGPGLFRPAARVIHAVSGLARVFKKPTQRLWDSYRSSSSFLVPTTGTSSSSRSDVSSSTPSSSSSSTLSASSPMCARSR